MDTITVMGLWATELDLPPWNATALTVLPLSTKNGEVYNVDAEVGFDPSSEYRISAPATESVMATRLPLSVIEVWMEG